MLRAALETAFLIALLAAALFGSAGSWQWPMAWAFLFVFTAFAAISFLILSPDLIRERSRLPPDIKPWDLVLSSVFGVLLYPATLVVCGLDARFAAALPIPLRIQQLALATFSAGYGFSLWAMRANPFFSAFVRIQQDRGHHVIDRGPYAVVRHPGYAGALLAHLALPIALGSLWGLVPAVLGAVLLVLRTAAEDRTLVEDLVGYREYTLRVRWRLLPGIW